VQTAWKSSLLSLIARMLKVRSRASEEDVAFVRRGPRVATAPDVELRSVRTCGSRSLGSGRSRGMLKENRAFLL
jgi:hypothetical protein